MAETKITYGTEAALAVSEWDATLAAGNYATSALFDNSTTLYTDVLVGGLVDMTGTSVVAGDSLDIYISGQYSDTANDMGGGIGLLFSASAEVSADVAFVAANLTLVKSVQVEATTPATTQGYNWGPIGGAQFFGGVMPKYFQLVLHNNTSGTCAASPNVNTVGITYTTA